MTRKLVASSPMSAKTESSTSHASSLMVSHTPLYTETQMARAADACEAQRLSGRFALLQLCSCTLTVPESPGRRKDLQRGCQSDGFAREGRPVHTARAAIAHNPCPWAYALPRHACSGGVLWLMRTAIVQVACCLSTKCMVYASLEVVFQSNQVNQ